MAFDEWLVGRAQTRAGSLYVRTYSWQPGAITFGLNQRQQSALDFSRLGGTPVIRRVTGGRALFHDTGELTYSVVVNTSKMASGKLTGSTAQLSRSIALALVEFLLSLGIASDYVRSAVSHEGPRVNFHKAPCFASNARHEIVGDKGKIVASAQRRIGDTFLQHGSIKLGGPVGHPALRMPPERMVEEATVQPLSEATFERLGKAFAASFTRFFDVELLPLRLTSHDDVRLKEAAVKVKEKALIKREIIEQT
jgi:lipoate-protein ligase A